MPLAQGGLQHLREDAAEDDHLPDGDVYREASQHAAHRRDLLRLVLDGACGGHGGEQNPNFLQNPNTILKIESNYS